MADPHARSDSIVCIFQIYFLNYNNWTPRLHINCVLTFAIATQNSHPRYRDVKRLKIVERLHVDTVVYIFLHNYICTHSVHLPAKKCVPMPTVYIIYKTGTVHRQNLYTSPAIEALARDGERWQTKDFTIYFIFRVFKKIKFLRKIYIIIPPLII